MFLVLKNIRYYIFVTKCYNQMICTLPAGLLWQPCAGTFMPLGNAAGFKHVSTGEIKSLVNRFSYREICGI
jgi:hypothetical protein